MAYALELDGVSKQFKGFTLEDVTLALPQGYIMGLIGVNGAGKSTTLKIIMDIIHKDKGSVRLFGEDSQHHTDLKQNIGFVFDESYFYGHLNAEQMKRIIAPFYVNWDEVRFRAYMQEFGLPHDRALKHFSKGMAMQFNIAIALSHHAKLIIMDEPTSGLDPIIRRNVLKILQQVVSDENASVLFSTHITTDLEKIADYITYIHKGRTLFCEEKDQLLETYALVKGTKSQLKRLGPAEQEALFVAVETTPLGFQGLVINRKEIQQKISGELVIETPSLEDIMYYTNQRSGAAHATV